MNSPLDLKDAFAALSSIPLSSLQQIAGDMMKEFLPLQAKLKSADPKVREEALKKAEELTTRMKDLLMKTYEEAGVDLKSLVASLNTQLKKK